MTNLRSSLVKRCHTGAFLKSGGKAQLCGCRKSPKPGHRGRSACLTLNLPSHHAFPACLQGIRRRKIMRQRFTLKLQGENSPPKLATIYIYMQKDYLYFIQIVIYWLQYLQHTLTSRINILP